MSGAVLERTSISRLPVPEIEAGRLGDALGDHGLGTRITLALGVLPDREICSRHPTGVHE